MTEAVPFDELLHEETSLALLGQKGGSTPRTLIPSGLCISAISRVVWAWPDPLPTRLKRVGSPPYRKP